MNIIMTILAFNFIIIIHELGHFAVAKWGGIKVLEFSLFVGPKLFSIKRGDTMYSLRLLPFLAYVKMEGEDESSESETSFSKKPLWLRALVVAAGSLANLCSAVVLFSIVFSIAGYNTTKIDEVMPGSPAYKSGVKVGDEILNYNNHKVYTVQNFLEFFQVSRGEPAKVQVLRDGKKIDLTMTPLKIPENNYLLGFMSYEYSNIVDSVEPGSSLDKAGIIKGDVIVKLNGIEVKDRTDITNYMNQNKGEAVNVEVIRDGKNIIFKGVLPILRKGSEVYILGISFGVVKGSMLKSISHSFITTYSNIRSVAYTLGWLISGKLSLRELVGPVGIVTIINKAAQQGEDLMQKFLSLLNMTAFISVAIGATNLVPFPALDGSKLMLLAIEGIIRRPIPIEKEAFITLVGFVLLIMLAIFTTTNDFIRLFS